MVRAFMAASMLLALGAGGVAGQEKPERVSLKVDKDKVDFLLNGELATSYQHGPDRARPLFFPVLAPGGVPVTRAWPLDKSNDKESIDHPHQQSMWFCHGDMIVEGHKPLLKIGGVDGVDFWSIRPGHGVIRQTARVRNEKETRLKTEDDWLDGDKVLLTDQRVIQFQEGPGGWMVRFRVTMTAPAGAVFGDTKEGAFALRVNDQMRADKVGNGQIRQPGGKKGEKECWGQKADWCDYAGKVDGKAVGITVFASPKNPSPTNWHVRGYGLMAANPFGRVKANFPGNEGNKELIRLGKGEKLTLEYAVHVYAGERTEESIAALAKGVFGQGQ